MSWVLDCSMAIGFGFRDEQSERAVDFVSNMPQDHSIWVPPLWWYELANVLVVARRRERITPAQSAELLALYSQLPLRTDIHVGGMAVTRTHQLALESGLSAYDAAYLELAMRRGLGLASLDEKLCDVAQGMGVPVY